MDERLSWVEAEHPLLSVRQQCALLEVNRSSIYYTPRSKNFSDKLRRFTVIAALKAITIN